MESIMKFNFRDCKKIFLVTSAVTMMGLSLSFLVRTNLGEDPYSFMNLCISSRICWTLGNWQALLNSILLLIVFFIGRHQIGIGTIANMFLVGYCYDLFTWIENFFMSATLDTTWLRITIAIPSLVLFILAAALYMTCDLGSSPYDALAFILYERIKKISKKTIPFRLIRILYDGIACLIGILFGQIPGILTILITLFLGPTIQWMSGLLKKNGIISQEI